MSYRIRSAREKQQVVDAWRRSGLPKTRFARENALPPTSLSKWIAAAEEAALPATRFVPVHVVEPSVAPAGPLVIQVAGTGHRVEVPAGFDAVELRRLVDALC